MPDANFDELVDNAAAAAKSTSFDGTTVEQQDLTALEDVNARRKADQGAKKTHRGLRFNKLVPPGAP